MARHIALLLDLEASSAFGYHTIYRSGALVNGRIDEATQTFTDLPCRTSLPLSPQISSMLWFGFRRAGIEIAVRAVCVFERGEGLVFDLDVVQAGSRLAGDRLRQAAEPGEDVQVVGSLVDKHTAALTPPRCTPPTGVAAGLTAVPAHDKVGAKIRRDGRIDRLCAPRGSASPRIWYITPNFHPDASAARIIASAAETVTPSGFSESTCSPRVKDSTAIGEWK